jgi:hypothetical protein
MRRVHAMHWQRMQGARAMDETRDEGTSMVGLPRESRISRAEMSLIVAARSAATPCCCLLCFCTESAGREGQK